jgi:hypothetical protein
VSGIADAWPVIVRLDEIARGRPTQPFERRLVADEAARATIAKALDLVAVDALEAELTGQGWFDGAAIAARWRAEIVQICGVELEPFSTTLEGDFQVRVVPAGSVHAPDPEAEIVIDLEADDPPDVLSADGVDLGLYVVEHLALDIDPFPRRPGAVFEAPPALPETSPFAALKALKKGGAEE